MKNLVVFDVDGVLLNSEQRINLWLEGKPEEYFAQAKHDTPIQQGLAICKMFLMNPNYRVVFVTGRGDTPQHRRDTRYDLEDYMDHDIRNDQLLMREYPEVGPHLHDAEKKPLMIQQAGYSLDDIFMVFEDRNSIVDMWRARGVVVYHTQPGNF
jgi:phosphoglycolate phosphatase-like HAD superfamily hydrolase